MDAEEFTGLYKEMQNWATAKPAKKRSDTKQDGYKFETGNPAKKTELKALMFCEMSAKIGGVNVRLQLKELLEVMWRQTQKITRKEAKRIMT
jgi:hypothetical protein